MDAQLPRVDVTTVVDLVNEYGTQPRAVAGEQDRGYPRLSALEGFRPSQAALVEAADRLHPAFTTPVSAPAVLNRLVTELGVHPYVADDGARGWASTRRRQALLASCTVTLVDWIAEHGLDRHGSCAAHRCVDVFVDTSRPGTRRYCSETCLNRARVANWRSRRRADGTGARG